MPESKKNWVKPEIIILVRSNPQNAVYGVCRAFHANGPNNMHNGCELHEGGTCPGACDTYCYS